jgi:transcriptional regulator with GAF, ATPase, and Fis domain
MKMSSFRQESLNLNINQADFFHQATVRICSSLDLEEAAKRCLTYLTRYIPARAIALPVYERDLGLMRLVAVATVEQALRLDHEFPLSSRGRLLAEWHEREDIRIVNDLASDPVGRQILIDAGGFLGEHFESLMVMRLQIEGRRFGDVALLSEGKERFKAEHADLFALLKEPFAIALSNYLRHLEVIELKDRLIDENRYLHREILEMSGGEIIGAEGGLRHVLEQVRQVAPLMTPVLLTGETGVGKEVIANTIVRFSSRRDAAFVKVNCGAIPESLIDSELFGHEKGAFTGAVSKMQGRFERAHQGTIFLDEVGELPMQAQVRFLRVLQNKEIERVGGAGSIPVDIRVIAATNRDLVQMVENGRFRRDLFFRLNVFPIHLPPLRERRADIPPLTRFFVEKKSREMNIRRFPELNAAALDHLMKYDWPGNVRELENLVERALIRNRNGPLILRPDAVERRPLGPDPPQSRSRTVEPLDDVMRAHIRGALDAAGGKVQGAGGAAELLDIHPNTLRKRMIKLGIPYGRQAGSNDKPLRNNDG